VQNWIVCAPPALGLDDGLAEPQGIAEILALVV
jgi:hypothetical protein